jgi:hypothetical protein
MLTDSAANRFDLTWRNAERVWACAWHQRKPAALDSRIVNYADGEILPEDAFRAQGVKVVVDPLGLPLIDRTVVDFVKQGLNRRPSVSKPQGQGRMRLWREFQCLGAEARRRATCSPDWVFKINTGTSGGHLISARTRRSSTLRSP